MEGGGRQAPALQHLLEGLDPPVLVLHLQGEEDYRVL